MFAFFIAKHISKMRGSSLNDNNLGVSQNDCDESLSTSAALPPPRQDGCPHFHRTIERNALTWEDVVSAMNAAIGVKDAALCIDEMKVLLDDPYFERDPVPEYASIHGVNRYIKRKNSNLVGHAWASPHPQTYRKLGVYQLWTPEGDVSETSNESKVEAHLLENRVKKAKL